MSGQLEKIVEAEQTWKEVAEHPGLFVGMWNAHKPTEEDLRRSPFAVDGKSSQMLNGESWTLPLLMYDTGNGPDHRLPSSMDYEHGEWVRRVREEYKEIGALALRMYDAIDDSLRAIEEKRAPKYNLTVKAYVEFVVAGLSVNYRVGREEVEMLGLIDPRFVLQHAGLMIGRDMIGRLRAIVEGKQGLGEPA
jgi:hypothetical protein